MLSMAACICTLASCGGSKISSRITKAELNATDLKNFEVKIEGLRTRYHIPSLSVGIVSGKQIKWYKGFGYADIENKVVPTRHTIYHLASVTKTFGSIILMQLVEQGKISLDDPVTKYGINLGARWGGDDRIKIKHLLTHTAMGNSFNLFRPGYSFRYNGDFYGRLGTAIEKSSGITFAELATHNILYPLQLKHTVPNLNDTADFNTTGYNRDEIINLVAKPYDWIDKKIVGIEYPTYFGPAAGLMSCVEDLAKYSNAIDERKMLKAETWRKVFEPTVSERGKVLPYGLGWFVKNYDGVKVIWHTGWWTGNSALFVKIPQRDVAFIVLANSQDLSRPFYPKINPFNPKLSKNLRKSAFGKAFLELVKK
jgi:CubicO group peptidase (beta-lactamase class C family)